MGRIAKTEDNIVSIPKSVSVTAKGYVYWNATTTWVDKANGTGKRADHKKECIGVILCPGSDWKKDRRMYANPTYYQLFPSNKGSSQNTKADKAATVRKEYPQRFDCISVGLYAVADKLAEESGLYDVLLDVFGTEKTQLILDLAMYMISGETAVMQHFPHWAASHAIFSDSIRSDSFISAFEKEISLSLINKFKNSWAPVALGDGRVFVCYDSTNTNSRAKGVFLVQKGHAKDDPEEEQVNTEYVIRQKDGLPITFNVYPGSINDISEAANMFDCLSELKKSKQRHQERNKNTADNISIAVIADRGYVSYDNIKDLRDKGIGFIFLLKKNMDITNEVLDNHIDEVKKSANFMLKNGKFALTVKKKIFPDDEKESWFSYIVYVSDQEMTAAETIETLVRRDGVEKTFRALKSRLGMDKIGVHSENSMQAKNLIWFVASVIRTLLFTKTETARLREKKRNSIPAVVDLLEEIRADKDLLTGTYARRYLPTKLQKRILNLTGVTLEDIDAVIENLTD
ncbi:transposase [Succinimonas sp.]|uniref:transposase n=1 Tax=Succinimonas sp. TaxID=1936151 RepID=UPI003862F6CF